MNDEYFSINSGIRLSQPNSIIIAIEKLKKKDRRK